MPRKQAVTTTTTSNRVGLKWNVNELNRLHNEYELKELDVYEIAVLHKRGVSGILHKLAEEGLISTSWNDARGWNLVHSKQPLLANKRTEKKALSTRAKKSCTFVEDEISELSDDNVMSESDEEYTLEDAQNDYDPYSYEDKINFFKGFFR
jgi:hypothetical protein